MVKGCLEACCKAEVEIMRKLREAYENDVAAINVSWVAGSYGGPEGPKGVGRTRASPRMREGGHTGLRAETSW